MKALFADRANMLLKELQAIVDTALARRHGAGS
jgi:hypothetical protein